MTSRCGFIPRYGFSLGIALSITFGLLFVMQLLIASGRSEAESREPLRWVDFVRVNRTAIVETTRDKPQRPPEPAEPPEMTRTTTGTEGGTIAVTITPPNLGGGVDIGGPGFGVADGEYLPLSKVMPAYPAAAQRSGIEGYAVVRYTVTALGTTRDIELVESSNPVFDRSCVDAASKFKYRPRYINGEAIEVPGVQNRCVYRLDD